MIKFKKIYFAVVLVLFMFQPLTAFAQVYGEGPWEVIGLGNMPCDEFTVKVEEESYRELAAIWLSGFMSGVNFTSEDIYDITWGEDLYVLTDLLIKRCSENPKDLLSDIASEMVYKRYKNKNFSSPDEIDVK
jgi:hypothetical protein